jgi:hypothetical protein
MNHETGWFHGFMTISDVEDYRLGTVVGDVVHNLRSALDYIVTALVDASSGAKLKRQHQFPIFDDSKVYEAKVGDAKKAVVGGSLDGVTCGLSKVWELQPFHRQEPEEDSLFVVNRLSNADKHRAIVQTWTNIGSVQFQLKAFGANIIDEVKMPTVVNYDANSEYEIVRVRFALPYPEEVQIELKSGLSVHFGAPAFGKYKLGHSVQARDLKSFCDYVAEVTDFFKTV